MLDEKQQQLIDGLWDGLSASQRAWLVGYINGRAKELGVVGGVAPTSNVTLNLVYATETGNAKAIAQSLVKAAKERGFKSKLTPINKITVTEISALKDPVIFVSSTHGEGDPPEMAHKFFDGLKAGGNFANLNYAVLGLGDRAYKEFCKVAADLDKAFSGGGGKAFHATTLLDVDYNDHVAGWTDAVLSALQNLVGHSAPKAAVSVTTKSQSSVGFTRLSTIEGTVKETLILNDTDSAKETYHIEVAFDADLPYASGDAAGIILPKAADGTDPTPRLYSIASSPTVYPNEVHLTVALAKHTLPDGSAGVGLGSGFLADKKVGDKVQFYIQRNQRFRLPEDGDKDIIMVGPGTGIAPFRAFVQERAERGAGGRNWLFFGDQHAHCDFLYQAEWQEALAGGALTRLDVAFSRDKKEKVYVQHRMQQHGKDIAQWLNDGAYFYVCGAKSPMSEDVEKTLIDILVQHGGKTPDTAKTYLEDLSEQDRYVKDVY
jgi:sulfite reductase alpha subunit-like flavoprotein